jgi:hypothetical protein
LAKLEKELFLVEQLVTAITAKSPPIIKPIVLSRYEPIRCLVVAICFHALIHWRL